MQDKLRVPPAMAFHGMADTPAHNAERIIHIFFNERAGEARPAQIVKKTAVGKKLVCWKCGVNSRPMPEGATADTRYVCSQCSPLGVVCGGQLDRCAFDNWSIPERYASGRDMQFSFRELVEYFVLRSEDVAAYPSARILFYRRNGLAWAVNATRERIALLGERERACFVAFYWAGMSAVEIASVLGIEAVTVANKLTEVKKKLSKAVIKP